MVSGWSSRWINGSGRLFIYGGGFAEFHFHRDAHQGGIGEPVTAAYGVFDESFAEGFGAVAYLPRCEALPVQGEQSSPVVFHQFDEVAAGGNAEAGEFGQQLSEGGIAIIIAPGKQARHMVVNALGAEGDLQLGTAGGTVFHGDPDVSCLFVMDGEPLTDKLIARVTQPQPGLPCRAQAWNANGEALLPADFSPAFLF